MFQKGAPKTGGRKKGVKNKRTTVLKDAIIEAAAEAHPQGLVGYLVQQAQTNPQAFLPLLGKTLPKEMSLTVNPLEEMTIAELTDQIAEYGAVVEGLLAGSRGAAGRAEKALADESTSGIPSVH